MKAVADPQLLSLRGQILIEAQRNFRSDAQDCARGDRAEIGGAGTVATVSAGWVAACGAATCAAAAAASAKIEYAM